MSLSNCTNATEWYADTARPGAPEGTKFISVLYSNETLYAMNECCMPQTVHRAGLNGCVLWCEATEELIEAAEKAEPAAGTPGGAVIRYMSECMEREFPEAEAYALTVDTLAISPAHPPSLRSVVLAVIIALAMR
ncbi:hypothetical protein ACHAQA_003201 [Verticillium albo-atrum]